MICLGIVGEYPGRIYDEVTGRPLYLAAQRWGFDEAEDDRWTPEGRRQASYGWRVS